MGKIILHLTHTDVMQDSRILKEISAIASIRDVKIRAIGLREKNGAINNKKLGKDVEIYTLNLLSDLFNFLPKSFFYVVKLIEFTLRLTFSGISMRPAVVHCHDTLVLPAGAIIKFFTGCKLVYDAHELESNKNSQSRIFAKGTYFIEARCWAAIDVFISVSDLIIEWYNREFGEKKSILVLNSPVFDSEVNDDEAFYGVQYLRDRYLIPTEKLIYVYVGILGPGRGIENIINAFSMPSVEAHIVFLGFGEYENMIIDLSNAHNNIHHHKAVAHNHVVDIIKSADIGLCMIENVSLSDFYCLPNKLFEYAFAGLHVLGSNFPEIDLYINKYELGWTCEPTFAGISNRISEINFANINKNVKDLSDLEWGKQSRRLIDAYNCILIS